MLSQLMYKMWSGMNKIKMRQSDRKTITTVPLDICVYWLLSQIEGDP